ncbi:SET domain-containing protein [Lachnellula occidentalis]|uniref:SET domain-containing protein n=1 Tax=Lachnellula occidentalis TaxID=215460 RepID=A0A8H8RU00_9HELO|nr:SET domain-containing protein [Lachnellula occidentalis]
MFLSLPVALVSLIYLTNASPDLEIQGSLCLNPSTNTFLNYSQSITEDLSAESCSHHKHAIRIPKSKPWSREPQCLTENMTNESYCVYTNERFANGRGISFFTTPSIAAKVTRLLAFTDPKLHNHVNKFDDDPPWEMRNIPGRGNGLFATRTLRRGDLILANTPMGVYQSDAFFPDYELGYKYLRKTFDQLPKSSREIFMRMATHSPGDAVMERINTNAFAGDFEGAPHFLLYPETALMNHDCRPNAMYYHNVSTLIHATHASRTIHPGEEITITYINLLQTRSQRQELLSSIWGFTCTCRLCTSPNAHLSDTHVSQILSLQNTLVDPSSSSPHTHTYNTKTLLIPSSQATPEMAEQLLALYAEEHLHAALGTGHLLAAQVYNGVGDAQMAVWHAKKAVVLGIVGSVDPESDMAQMRQLIEDPRGHWSFGHRKKR